MAARVLDIEPPSSEYVHDGWHCHYHRVSCHNPLDCDLSPKWRLTDEAFYRVLAEKPRL
jgi:hypothetical protein